MCTAGQVRPAARHTWASRAELWLWRVGVLLHNKPPLLRGSPPGSSLLPSAGCSWTVWASGREAMAAEGGVSQPDGAQGASRRGWPLGQADLIRQSQEGGHADCAKGLGQGWQGGGRFASELAEARWPACVTPMTVSLGFQGQAWGPQERLEGSDM